jgi:hypothetical protein
MFSSYGVVKVPVQTFNEWIQTPIKIPIAITSLKRLQTQLADQQLRAAAHPVQIRQLRKERSRDEREGDSFGRRQAIQITTYPDS